MKPSFNSSYIANERFKQHTMPTAKTTAFTPADVQQAEWAKALAHPARITILKVLAAKQTCLCGEIVDELPLAQATVSQHLKVLKDAGLIAGEIEGPRVCYCLDRTVLAQVRDTFATLFASLDHPGCC
jgi:DNA-binding transcriptional ArsR family regulator